jgi:hypothetical protein
MTKTPIFILRTSLYHKQLLRKKKVKSEKRNVKYFSHWKDTKEIKFALQPSV